ncbi:nucleotide pyrophosphatase/phosphodiesterase family protein [Actinomycetospora sp. NBRC 106378]|uniref:alkaline phosphatase family protein n=1 Tax=Actinomycetospora sp. NBRC 106378 TaxID=3032208 RepID=UPI0024A5F07D|nr:nucleotide pyrophosphatase/phosphodiesterase family protein [Actinomycetospora sp. NBRC 106378]GLZ55472.1 phosphodiesterase [Actinomycetospora sp. NBRC 106378]
MAGLDAVLPAMLRALGDPLPDEADDDGAPRLALPPARNAVLLLVDGLGRDLLDAHTADAPFLAGLRDVGPLQVGFPTSTPISVTSLGTGLPPGAHGTLGVRFRVDDVLLDALTWTRGKEDLRARLVPERVQARPTVFERTAVPCTVVSDRAFRESGLTRSGLRGATYRGVGSFGDLAAEILAAPPGLTYGYHADLDQLGHLHGPGSPAWRRQLRMIDHFCAMVAEDLPSGTLLAVTGDHGMVTVDRRHDADTHPALREHEPLVGGDPRARLLYCRPGTVADVHAAWTGTLGEDALVVGKEEALDEQWFGPVDAALAERVPDLLVALRGSAAVIRSVDEPVLARLPGQHGSTTDAERLVPLLLHVAGAVE